METFDSALIESLKMALGGETDETRALRTAMLGLIFLVQDDANPALRRYLEFLLSAFPPLSGSFVDERQPFLDGHPITRRWMVDHTELLLHEAFMWDLVEQSSSETRDN